VSTKPEANGVVMSKTGKAASPKARTARKKKRKEEVVEVTERCEGILCPAAMDNLYYIAHDAADALRLRGFLWHQAKGGKKKKGKKANI